MLTSALRLEVEPELELDQATARIVGARHGEVAVGGARLAKARVIDADRARICRRAGDKEVRAVKGVQQLHARLETGALGDARALDQVEVEARSLRAGQEDA